MKYVVVGSGPSGTNAALTLLRRGKAVELWDVGRGEAAYPRPEADFHQLKKELDDPQEYFLGRQFEALLAPGSSDLLRYPPSRSFLLDKHDPLYPFETGSFNPFGSLTRGGLGRGWGANAVSYDDDDIQDWPVSVADLGAAYREASSRMPIAGEDDALSPFFPGMRFSGPAMRLSDHDEGLLAAYRRRAKAVQRWSHVIIGRARIAAVNSTGLPSACRYCGRCLWGCPQGSLYDPAATTLAECELNPRFAYKSGRLVLDFEAKDGRIASIRYLDISSGAILSASCSAVFLAAGALQSGGIFLRTLQRDPVLKTEVDREGRTASVMDTTVVKMPYIRLRSVGKQEAAEQFQFNRLIAAHRKSRTEGWPVHCHGELLSLNTLIYHPLVESIPLGTRHAMRLFARFRPALGVVTWFFPDKPVPGNGISLVPDPGSPTGDRMHVHYRESDAKQAYICETVSDTRRAMLMLGCLPWPPMRAPAGAGIHYAGTVPMGEGPLRADASGRSHAYDNLYLCDGAAFPSLPSKSITFNLVAHAIRVATLADV